MYVPDMSVYPSVWPVMRLPTESVLAVGWLEYGQEYPKGEVAAATIAKLKTMLRLENLILAISCGFHICDLDGGGIEVDGETRPITCMAHGSYDVWIPSANREVIYVAPELICHYVEVHAYRPPDAFIEAIDAFDVDSKWDMRLLWLRSYQ